MKFEKNLDNCFLLLFLFFFSNMLFSQEIVTDTLLIRFQKDTLLPEAFFTRQVSDLRTEHNRVVGYSSKKKYLLFPVEQEICLPVPLSNYLKTPLKNNFSDSIDLEITYFTTDRYRGHFFSNYLILADIRLYHIQSDSQKFIGTLVYNFQYQPPSKKTSKADVVEQMLPKWHTQFKLDLLTTQTYIQNKGEKPENLLEMQFEKPHFLNVVASATAGLNFWQLDGEIYLTRPETAYNRWFMAQTVRYQNTPDFEMFAIGKKSEHYTKRINNNVRFDLNSNLMVGFVKWRENEEIKLFQVIQFSLSSNQCMVLEKKNQPGWILKTGLFENFYYVIEMEPKIQLGLYLGTGYKF